MKKGIGFIGLAIIVLLLIIIAALLFPQIIPDFKSATCSSLESGINIMIDRSNYCNSSSDCVVLDVSCKLGCFSLVNKGSNMGQILNLSRQYIETDCGACTTLCTDPPNQTDIICISSKCVDKRTIEAIPFLPNPSSALSSQQLLPAKRLEASRSRH